MLAQWHSLSALQLRHYVAQLTTRLHVLDTVTVTELFELPACATLARDDGR